MNQLSGKVAPVTGGSRGIGAATARRLAREREELRELLEDQARHLTEARDTQRRRAERAEHDLDAARAELAQLRSTTAAADASTAPRRRRGGQS
jgi:3-oxoacyl-[acyl-carrier protein] reductase